MRKYIFITFIFSFLVGCGESYPEAAKIYLGSVKQVLINKGICNDQQDCGKQEFLFYAGGNPWVPSLNMAFVSLYNVNNSELVDAAEQALRETQIEINGPPVKLSIYSSAHLQNKILYKEIVIK